MTVKPLLALVGGGGVLKYDYDTALCACWGGGPQNDCDTDLCAGCGNLNYDCDTDLCSGWKGEPQKWLIPLFALAGSGNLTSDCDTALCAR